MGPSAPPSIFDLQVSHGTVGYISPPNKPMFCVLDILLTTIERDCLWGVCIIKAGRLSLAWLEEKNETIFVINL